MLKTFPQTNFTGRKAEREGGKEGGREGGGADLLDLVHERTPLSASVSQRRVLTHGEIERVGVHLVRECVHLVRQRITHLPASTFEWAVDF